MSRKIIHIDMDCFYAAIEAKDNPELRNKPLAVGGVNKRSVICTCNYPARKFGIHSAMPTPKARQLCPNLIVMPVRMQVYKQISHEIHQIFHQFTDLVEPLSLDEAYLDVTGCDEFKNSATLIAQEIRKRIYATHQITASAGIAPNKFLAKIASDWNKPDGQCVITPDQIDNFIENLSITKIFGVGRITAAKLNKFGIQTCKDLQKVSRTELKQNLGLWGAKLYNLCRGIDDRPVEPKRIRKSLSVEKTFTNDFNGIEQCLNKLPELFSELQKRLNKKNNIIKKQFIKIKFNDFNTTTVEIIVSKLSLQKFEELCKTGFDRHQKPVRLLGLGVRFANDANHCGLQQELGF